MLLMLYVFDVFLIVTVLLSSGLLKAFVGWVQEEGEPPSTFVPYLWPLSYCFPTCILAGPAEPPWIL